MKKILFFAFSLLLLFGCTERNFFPSQKIPKYNAHEHIESSKEIPKLLEAMDRAGIRTTILLGSPHETIFNGSGFTDYKKNNDEIVHIIKKYPERFIFFPTLGPENNSVELLSDYIRKGAKGLKLYNGHSLFYPVIGPLNRSELMSVYAYAEKNKIPIIYHVNSGNSFIYDEFIAVLDKFPNLTVNCPHFCLSSTNTARFELLMNEHQNLYIDISFGFFAEDGLKRISKNPKKYRNLVIKYQDRIMFGTDVVVTSHKRKTADWIYNLTKCYMDMLSKDKYSCNVSPDFSGNFNGLSLDKEVLDKIYYYNAVRFLGTNSTKNS